jgi:hypothetical protein
VIALLLIGLDPTFQQLVGLASGPGMSNLARPPRVSGLNTETEFQTESGGDFMTAIPTIAATVNGFYVREGFVPEVSAFCSSDRCTWPTFDTLSICSDCSDISEELRYACVEESGDWLPQASRGPITSCGWFFNVTESLKLMVGRSNNTGANSSQQPLLMR